MSEWSLFPWFLSSPASLPWWSERRPAAPTSRSSQGFAFLIREHGILLGTMHQFITEEVNTKILAVTLSGAALFLNSVFGILYRLY